MIDEHCGACDASGPGNVMNPMAISARCLQRYGNAQVSASLRSAWSIAMGVPVICP